MNNKVFLQSICLVMLFSMLIFLPNINNNSTFPEVKAAPYDSSWEWSLTDVVSTESTEKTEYPIVDVDSDGNVHVMWQDFTAYDNCGLDIDIFYKCWNATTKSWTITEVVSTESTADSWHFYYPSMVVDLSGNVHISWEDRTNYEYCGPDTDIFYKKKFTNGTWTTTEIVSSTSSESSWDPDLGVDSSGNVHVVWQDATSISESDGEDDIYYRKWTESTETWGDVELVSSESSDNAYKPVMIVDSSGNVHVAWNDVTDYGGADTDGDVFYKRRTAAGSWSTTEVVSNCDTHAANPGISVDGTGAVHIVWQERHPTSGYDINYRVKTISWSSIQNISLNDTAYSSEPVIDTDTFGNVHVAWMDDYNYDACGTDSDIFYRRWASHNSSWLAVDVLSTESTARSEFPSIVTDSTGVVHVVWHDSTSYGGAGSGLDIFYKKYIEVDNVAPDISSVGHSPVSPTELDSINISATITDDSGIDSAAVHYRIDGSSLLSSPLAEGNNDLYSVLLGPFSPGNLLTYYVNATDASDKLNEGSEDNGGVYYTILIGDSDVTAPIISGISCDPSIPTELDTVTISASVTDSSGISHVTIYYTVDGSTWVEDTMIDSGGVLYTADIGSFSRSETIDFYIVAVDDSINHNTEIDDNSGMYYSFTIDDSDLTGPEISSITHDPSPPTELDTVTISASVTDSSGVSSVYLKYSVDGGSWQTVSMLFTIGSTYTVEIGMFTPATVINYYIQATDSSTNANIEIDDNGGLNYSLTVTCSDVTGPEITSIAHSPTFPVSTDEIIISAYVSDSSGIQSVVLYYRVNSEAPQSVEMVCLFGSTYEVNIGAFDGETTIVYYITATDNSINHNTVLDDNDGLYYAINVAPVIVEYSSIPQVIFSLLSFSILSITIVYKKCKMKKEH